MTPTSTPFAGRLRQADCRVEDLRELLETQPDPQLTFTDRIEQQVPIYDAATLRAAIATEEGCAAVESELAHVLADGPGIFVMAGALAHPVVDRVSAAFEEIITTDTLPQNTEGWKNLTVLSIAPLLAKTIREIFENGSVTTLFEGQA